MSGRSDSCCIMGVVWRSNCFKCMLLRQEADARDYPYQPLVTREVRGVVGESTCYQTCPRKSLELVMPPSLNQGKFATCAANVASNAVRHVLGLSFQPSRMQIYYHARLIENLSVQKDCGTTLRSVCQAVRQHSVIDERHHQYNSENVGSRPPEDRELLVQKRILYLSVPQSLEHIKACINEGYPILFGMTVFQSSLDKAVNLSGNIPMPSVTEKPCGGHGVLLVGYDDVNRTFNLQNTWGSKWGRNGFGTIPYDFVLSPLLAFDFWTLRAT